jgi:tetratricopeptide (TPR) repeat protein
LEGYLACAAESGARVFHTSCDFDLYGPWAGAKQFIAEMFPEIQAERPDLIERHSSELISILPELSRSLTVHDPTLTDSVERAEKTRNYPADRAYRSAQGLIELLDSWKGFKSLITPWLIACDAFDAAGAIGGFFFGELLRRRAKKLNIRLVAAVQLGAGIVVQQLLHSSVQSDVLTLDIPKDPIAPTDPADAARQAEELEEQIGDDVIELQVHLAELITLWRMAARSDKLFEYKARALEIYDSYGLYRDALRYSEGLLGLASRHAPEDTSLRFSLVMKLIMSFLSLGDADSALRLAEDEGEKLAASHPEIRVDLYYLLSMIASRFSRPRNFVKGEEYLELGLQAIEEAGFSEGMRYFKIVFNRNGLAMIRNFQGRLQEALELCKTGLETLNTHLAADEHRLHRSVLVYNMAQVYAAIGCYDEALQNFTAAMRVDPNYSEYYNDRGNLFLKLDRLEEAKADYLKAIELSPPYFEVFVNLGQCCRRMGDMASAIEYYSRAIDIEPKHVLALLGRAKAYEELGATQEAIEDYTAGLKLDPTIWEALASRGVLHYEAGRFADSLHDFNAALALKKHSADLYQNRATVLTDLGRNSEAIDDLHAALRLGVSPDDELAILEKLEKLTELAVPAKFARLTI